MSSLTSKQAAMIIDVARKLRISDAKWLDVIMYSESRYSPDIKNPSARAFGLIQFTPIAALELGYYRIESSGKKVGMPEQIVERFPTFEKQLYGPVLEYYKRNKPPYPTLQSLALATFFPAYRDKPVNTIFPEWVRSANPGLNTPADYLVRLNKNLQSPSLALNKYEEEAYALYNTGKVNESGKTGIPVLPIAVAVAVGAYFLMGRG